MELDEDNVPLKEKHSHLTVVSDKQTGVLGGATLDITKFGYNNKYIVHKLPLDNSVYEGSYIILELASPLTRPSVEK